MSVRRFNAAKFSPKINSRKVVPYLEFEGQAAIARRLSQDRRRHLKGGASIRVAALSSAGRSLVELVGVVDAVHIDVEAVQDTRIQRLDEVVVSRIGGQLDPSLIFRPEQSLLFSAVGGAV